MQGERNGAAPETVAVVGRGRPVAEGRFPAVVASVVAKDTRKGRFRFLACRIAEPGREFGRVVEYLVPGRIKEGSRFHAFVASALGRPVVPDEDVDLNMLVGARCMVTVRHVTRGRRTYANVVGLSPADAGKRQGKRSAGRSPARWRHARPRQRDRDEDQGR